MEQKFKEFINTYYPLPKAENIDVSKIGRSLWYCNCSKKYIPELQKYNKCGEQLEYKSNGLLCSQYYEKGYTDYRVYECGHCFLDIHLLGMYFDYLNYCWSPKPSIDILHRAIERMKTDCPMCEKHSYNMYEIWSRFTTGTVILNNCVPKKVLKYIKSEFKVGDVVDTEGYRGIGLRIFNGIDFEHVPREEYYPIWEYSYIKLRGYIYYLKKYNIVADLEFKNNISISSFRDNFYTTGDPKEIEMNPDEYIKITDKDSEGFYEVDFPSTPEEMTAYLKCPHNIKIKVWDNEYMKFSGETERVICFENLDRDCVDLLTY